jgi:hypothetical protein
MSVSKTKESVNTTAADITNGWQLVGYYQARTEN